MGNVEVSPVTHRVFVIHDNAQLNAILVGRCDPVPFTARPSGLSCVDLPVTIFPGFKTGANFPTLAIDSAGNLFAVWEQAPIDEDGDVVGDTLLYWSSSKDKARRGRIRCRSPRPASGTCSSARTAVPACWPGGPSCAAPALPRTPSAIPQEIPNTRRWA